MTTVAEVLAFIERRFPVQLAEEWDVNGLTVGDPSATVSSVLLAVDPTLEVANEALEVGAQLLITHHPLMLRGVTSVAADTAKGAVVHRLATSGVALANAHTNADHAEGGVSDALAVAIGASVTGPLVAIDASKGTGRLGTVSPTSLEDFARRVAAALPPTAGGVLFSGPADAVVETIAVVGGAGDSFLDAAVDADVDVYVTADLRHHPASDAREAARLRGGRPYLVSVSHAASESLWLEGLARELEGLGVRCAVSRLNTDPWTGRVGYEDQATTD
jgi:dinuclear metal center YbgI/SA1388 family protein